MWNASDDQMANWNNVIMSKSKTKTDTTFSSLLAFNEPDQCTGGGTCVRDVAFEVDIYKKYLQPLCEDRTIGFTLRD
jgi:hypothetical protein